MDPMGLFPQLKRIVFDISSGKNLTFKASFSGLDLENSQVACYEEWWAPKNGCRYNGATQLNPQFMA